VCVEVHGLGGWKETIVTGERERREEGTRRDERKLQGRESAL
jgi:hypothetical protein